MTAPRRLIVRAFLASGGHITAEELAAVVQAEDPEIAVSTVYRTMEALEEVGGLHHLHLGHGPAVYHRADEAHHHLACEDCGSVVELDDAMVAPFAAELRRRTGFELDARHFAFPGRCSDCVSHAASGSSGFDSGR